VVCVFDHGLSGVSSIEASKGSWLDFIQQPARLPAMGTAMLVWLMAAGCCVALSAAGCGGRVGEPEAAADPAATGGSTAGGSTAGGSATAPFDSAVGGMGASTNVVLDAGVAPADSTVCADSSLVNMPPVIVGCVGSKLRCVHPCQMSDPDYGAFTACCPGSPDKLFSCPNGTPNVCFVTADAAFAACGSNCVKCVTVN
jgi:hypothetical protein